MEVRTGRATSRTDVANLGPGVDAIALMHRDGREVRVARLEAVGVPDGDEVAVRAGRAGVGDLPARRGRYRGAGRGREVEPRVGGGRTVNRIFAEAIP
jgi:hypothetical protein